MILAHGDPTRSPLTPHLHPDVVAFVAALAVAYWLALTRLGPRVLPPGEPAWTRREARFVVAGIAALTGLSTTWPRATSIAPTYCRFVRLALVRA